MSSPSDLPELFECARSAGLRITATFCAASWRKGKGLGDKSLDTALRCRGCAIGAGHAGEPVESSREVCRADKVCARCGNGARKLVYGILCLSCYNREAEVLKGRNARGTAPVRARPLRPHYLRLGGDGGVSRMNLPRVAWGVEGALAAIRQHAGAVHLQFWRPMNSERT